MRFTATFFSFTFSRFFFLGFVLLSNIQLDRRTFATIYGMHYAVTQHVPLLYVYTMIALFRLLPQLAQCSFFFISCLLGAFYCFL